MRKTTLALMMLVCTLVGVRGANAQTDSSGVLELVNPDLATEKFRSMYELVKDTVEKETGEYPVDRMTPKSEFVRLTSPVLGYPSGTVMTSYTYQTRVKGTLLRYRFVFGPSNESLGMFGGVNGDDPFDSRSHALPEVLYESVSCTSREVTEDIRNLRISAVMDWNSRERYAKLGNDSTGQFTWGQCSTDLDRGLVYCKGDDSSKSFKFVFDFYSNYQTDYSALCLIMGGYPCYKNLSDLKVTIRTDGFFGQKTKTYTYKCER